MKRSPAREPRAGERVTAVWIDDDTLAVDLVDGRAVSVPLAWYPSLLDATSEERQNFVVSAAGYGIHWPDVDENVSVHGMLAGAAAPGVKVAV